MAIYLLDSVIRPFNNRVQNNNQNKKKKTKGQKTEKQLQNKLNNTLPQVIAENVMIILLGHYERMKLNRLICSSLFLTNLQFTDDILI